MDELEKRELFIRRTCAQFEQFWLANNYFTFLALVEQIAQPSTRSDKDFSLDLEFELEQLA